MIVDIFIAQGYPVSKVLAAAKLPPSSYYYQPKTGQAGKKPSEYTLTCSGQAVANSVVVIDIEALLQSEFVDYGYLKVTHWLRQHKGYLINPKKVYRLMKLAGLLNPQRRAKIIGRRWITELVPLVESPFSYLEIDIKYIYIHGQRRNALLLSLLDVDSRWLMGWQLAFNIRQRQVVNLMEALRQGYPFPQSVYLRSDNGSQFVSTMVREYLLCAGITQEFTRPATPQQNGHIESYHSIIERVICSRYELENLAEALAVFQRWNHFYNYERIHSGIGYLTPYQHLFNHGIDMQLWQQKYITNSAQKEQSQIGENCSRN